MTADVELLPLPEKSEIDRHLPTGVRVYGYTSDDMRAYARANVAHATAARDAEIEALRAERDVYKAADESMQQAHYEALTRAREAEARAERLAEALRGLVLAGVAMRNTVVETRGIRGMDDHDIAINKARAALEQETTNG